MYKKILIFLFVTLLYLIQTGCGGYSYEGLHNVAENNANVNPQRVIMFIGASSNINYQNVMKENTKGTGVVAGLHGFEGKDFRIYSFLGRNQTSSYQSLAVNDTISCLIDGSLDDPETLMGREAVWNPESQLIDWKHTMEPVFYPMGEALGLTYDFFAYYVDDMQLKNEDFHRSDDSVEIDIEIDGCQDLMSAVAAADDKELWYGTEDSREYAYRKECTYSYYTAQLNIHPRFIFKHHLTKLDFKIVPRLTPGVTKTIKVEKIEVYSKTKGTFVVAHKEHNHVGNKMGVFFKGERQSMVLKEKDGSEFQERTVITTPDNTPGTVIEDLGSLLVAPDQEYYLYITLSEYHGDIKVSESERNELHLYLGNAGPGEDSVGFEAGSEYLVTLNIYGTMDVQIDTELVEWNTGGGTTADPEFRPDIN